MALVDTDVCIASGCPFVCKSSAIYQESNNPSQSIILQKGICLPALVRRVEKRKACVSTVDIRVKKK